MLAALRRLFHFYNDLSVPGEASQIGKRPQRLDTQAALVEFGLDHLRRGHARSGGGLGFFRRAQRAAFHPAVAHAKILCESVCVPGGMQELVGLPQVVPLLPGEAEIAAFSHIIPHRDNEQGSGISGCPGVGELPEPIHESGGLGNLMRNFAVGTLVAGNEVQRLAGVGKIAFRVESERTPLGIAAEVPREAGALAVTRSAVAGYQPRAQVRIGHHTLPSHRLAAVANRGVPG